MWPSVPPTASAYFNSFGIAGIGQPKTRRLVVHASRQHVSSRVRRIADSIRRVLGTVPTSARSQPIWTPCLLNVISRSSNRSSSGSALKIGGRAHTRDIPALRRRGRWSNACKKERTSCAPPACQPTQARGWTAMWSSRASCWPVRLSHRQHQHLLFFSGIGTDRPQFSQGRLRAQTLALSSPHSVRWADLKKRSRPDATITTAADVYQNVLR